MRSPEEAEKTLEAFVAESPAQSELRMALGRLYETNRKPEAALTVYEELAAAEPKSRLGLAARVRVVALRIGKGEFDEGRRLLDALLGDAPENADALLMRAGLNVRDGSFPEALADVRTALRKQPDNSQALLLLARIHGSTKEHALAKDAYRRLLAIDPGNAAALRELVTLQVLDDEASAAIEVLRAHLKLRPDDLDAGGRLVSLLVSRQAWSAAEAEAQRMAQLPGNQGAGDFQLGRVYRAQGRQDAAVRAFRSALDQTPSSIIIVESLVTTLNAMGKKAEARQVVQDFRARYPDDVTGRFLEGSLAMSQGDTSGARTIFSEIVSARPGIPMAWVALAGLEDKDRAARIATYQQGLAANPGSSEIGLRLGVEYQESGQFAEAIDLYEDLLAVNPRIDVARNNLASLLLDYRQDAASHARALELAQPLASSTDPLVLDTVGWAYYRNKEFDQAVKYLEMAVRAGAELPQLRYHLGMAHLATGNTEAARRELSRAVSPSAAEFPGSAEARAQLANLRP
jgi:tetratricopeptide (TPR) repeat protein